MSVNSGEIMNQFGGSWTEQKIEIVFEYTQAYLNVMKNQPHWKLLYFDGFAGSGQICLDKNEEDHIEGAARRILSIEEPKSFDVYYFVEKITTKANELELIIKSEFKKRTAYVVSDDCNKKLMDMATFLKTNGEDFRVLAFIDPCGMQLNWSSLEALKGLGIDMWILVPIGIGANRLLKNDGNIDFKWMEKLVSFLGMGEKEIMDYFYIRTGQQGLFEDTDHIVKMNNAIKKLGLLYRENLYKIFNHVSEPFVMKNIKNNEMYHFILGSNNKTAVKIANDIVGKWSQ